MVPQEAARSHRCESVSVNVCCPLPVYVWVCPRAVTLVWQVQGDTFLTVKALFTLNPAVVQEFFRCSYDPFFAIFNTLLSSDNFVTRKESLKVGACR